MFGLTFGMLLKYRISLVSVRLGGIKLKTDRVERGLDFASNDASITIHALIGREAQV